VKSGQVPIHIMRWAPSDFVNDPFVKLLVSREDFATFTLYNLVLNWSHLEGGDLSSDTEQLAAVVGMRPKTVEKSLKVCVAAGKLVVEGGRVYHRRVIREVAKELGFREKQAEAARKRWDPAIDKVASGKPQATHSQDSTPSLSPPSPSPDASAVRRTPTPDRQPASQPNEAPEQGPRRNPLVDREALLREGDALVRRIATAIGRDPTEVLGAASTGNGTYRGRRKVSLEAMNDDRLANTLIDLRAEWARVRPPEEATDTLSAVEQFFDKSGIRDLTHLAEQFIAWAAQGLLEISPDSWGRYRAEVGAPDALMWGVVNQAVYAVQKQRRSA
jgi:hypothetical protein